MSARNRRFGATAIAAGLFAAVTSVAAAQDSAAAAAQRDSAQAASQAKAAACKQLQAFGKQAAAEKLTALRKAGTLPAWLDSTNSKLQGGGNYDQVLKNMLGIATLPDSMQAVATTAGSSCKMVPANTAFGRMVGKEMEKGPRIGIIMAPVTAQAAKDAGLSDTRGILVQSVTAGLGAQAAGVAAGDVIVGLDGKPVGSGGEWRQLASGWKDGDTVTLDVVRKGGAKEKIDVKVKQVE